MPTFLQGIDPSVLFSSLAAILTLAVTVAHSRGKRLPIIENILDLLIPKKPATPAAPAQPVDPTQPVAPAPAVPAAPSFPILNAILDALRQNQKVQFTHDPTSGDQTLGITGKK